MKFNEESSEPIVLGNLGESPSKRKQPLVIPSFSDFTAQVNLECMKVGRAWMNCLGSFYQALMKNIGILQKQNEDMQEIIFIFFSGWPILI